MSHDPSEIILECWFDAQETFIIINVENICAALYFCGNHDCFIFGNIINSFIANFEQFNVFLLKKVWIFQKYLNEVQLKQNNI